MSAFRDGSIDNSPERREPRHIRRIAVIWAVLSAVATPIVYYVLGPHLAPGQMTDSALSEQWDMTVLLSMATPVMLLVYVWFGYNLTVFRYRGGPIQDGWWTPRDNTRIQVAWVLATSVIVLYLAGFGTYELVGSRAGAGGGEGPSAIWTPKAQTAAVWTPKPHGRTPMLEVQVIGQQWNWTYRYPQFGAMETTYLELPLGSEVQFNVTSLDVIHDFWAYRLGVKADANPGVNNIAFTKPRQTGPFTVRCDELCGIWHGAMVSYGRVVSQQAFLAWARHQEQANAATTKQLPAYSLTYYPSDTGADGGYYTGLTSTKKTDKGS